MISHSILINASREVVFGLYQDVASWPKWDEETTAVRLQQGLRPGAVGWLKPRQGPRARIRVRDVMPLESFTVEGQLPWCRMIFGHDLKSVSGQTNVTHWVAFEGPLAFLFRKLIGAGIDSSLPRTLQGLKRASEANGGGR